MGKYRLKSGLYSRKEDGKRKLYRPGDIVEGDFSGNNKFEPVVEVEVVPPADESGGDETSETGGKGKGKGSKKKADESPADESGGD
jgi:hypothetical protein